jgi:hypothetical protein
VFFDVTALEKVVPLFGIWVKPMAYLKKKF